MGETVEVFRPSTTDDRYGDAQPAYPAEPTHTVDHAAFAPTGSTEDNDARNAVASTADLYVLPGADLRAIDRVRVRGEMWEVVGDVAVWVSSFDGAAAGVVARLRRVDG